MNIRLYYEEKGVGDVLILLHGNGEDHTYFIHQTECFSKYFRVIAIDTRGHGKSERGDGPFTICQFAEDLYAFMKEKGIEKAGLLGFSDGGNIALEFALRHPEMVEALILNGANLNPGGVKRSVQLPIEIGYRISSWFAGRSEKARRNSELLGLMVNEPDIEPSELKALKMPVLVIAGTEDMILEQHTQLIHRSIPGSRIVFIPGDHFVANKNPEAFNQAVLSFLKIQEGLLEQLQEYSRSDAYPLHMPGHKRRMSHFEDPFAIDITEIDGFDNLHHAEGVLLEAQRRAAKLYGAEETYYLINGSTCGILAAVSACVRRGGRLLMARNCHKAAYHAAFLNGLHVSYLYPEMDWERGIYGSITPEAVEAALADLQKEVPASQVAQPGEEDGRIAAVLLTSPTYDGVGSDIRSIAEVVHQAGAVLIVDGAHGAHFGMHPYFPQHALAEGADIVINSLHKTLPSLTQTALLHIRGDLVDRKKLKRYLGIYESSSPSYVLMAGMDACVRLLMQQGDRLFDVFVQRLEKLRTALGKMKALRLVEGRQLSCAVWSYDASKVLIATDRSRLDGPQLAQILREKYRLEAEMAAPQYVTAILTVSDTQEGFERLEHALLEIDGELSAENRERSGNRETFGSSMEPVRTDLWRYNEEVFTMEETEDMQQETAALDESGGRVSAEFVYLYPPGIPLLAPGERISGALLQDIRHFRKQGLTLQGLDDYKAEQIRVVIER